MFGLTPEQARAAVSSNCRAVIMHGGNHSSVGPDDVAVRRLNLLTPTVAIMGTVIKHLCRTGLSRHL